MENEKNRTLRNRTLLSEITGGRRTVRNRRFSVRYEAVKQGERRNQCCI